MFKKINYRDVYFRRQEERCAYCLKTLDYKDITVDHIISQNFFRKMKRFLDKIAFLIFIFGVYRTYELQKTLGFTKELLFSLSNIFFAILFIYVFLFASYRLLHSRFNLVASCLPCNQKKSDKIDHRVIIGFVTLFFKRFLWQTLAILELIYIVKHIEPGFISKMKILIGM